MLYILQNFFQSGVTGKSYLTFEWTNQHGSGGNDDTNPHKMNSNIVLQYKCQWVPQTVDAETLRNGVNTNTPKFTASNKKDENAQQYQSRKNGDKDINRGLHESWDWYEKCKRRERNQGEDLLLTVQSKCINKKSIIIIINLSIIIIIIDKGLISGQIFAPLYASLCRSFNLSLFQYNQANWIKS